MKIILQADIAKLGKRFDVKDVSAGHALNFLIPKKLAIAATPQALKSLEVEKARNEGEKKIQEELLAKNMADLDGKAFTIKEKANEKGHLFAGLHKEEIASRLSAETRLAIDPSVLNLEHPIKEVGKHDIALKMAGKSGILQLIIEPA